MIWPLSDSREQSSHVQPQANGRGSKEQDSYGCSSRVWLLCHSLQRLSMCWVHLGHPVPLHSTLWRVARYMLLLCTLIRLWPMFLCKVSIRIRFRMPEAFCVGACDQSALVKILLYPSLPCQQKRPWALPNCWTGSPECICNIFTCNPSLHNMQTCSFGE